MATGFLHTSTILSRSAMFNLCELYIAVLAIEWQISQYFKQPDRTNWEQVMDHFSKGM